MLKVGDVAPDFPIRDTTLYRLLEEEAAAVFFFPRAFTPGCTKEATEFREEFAEPAPALEAATWRACRATRRRERRLPRAKTRSLPFPLVQVERRGGAIPARLQGCAGRSSASPAA